MRVRSALVTLRSGKKSLNTKVETYPKQPVIYGLDVVEESLGFTEDY